MKPVHEASRGAGMPRGRGRRAPGSPSSPFARCRPAAAAFIIVCLIAPLASCESGPDRQLPQVIRTLPHDPEAYTQGLLLHDGNLYESTGRYGESSVREVDPETGEVLRILELEEEYFGEGLARVGSRLIQLTWKSRIAFVYDLETFALERTFDYDTDGWGLCYDGQSLFMTAGGAHLYRRDPETFELLDTRQVTLNGRPLWQINELECVGDSIYANVYQTNTIVRIDKRTGRVLAEIDASELATLGGRLDDSEAVLNGIAYDPRSETFYLTGKLWPTMFEVGFVAR